MRHPRLTAAVIGCGALLGVATVPAHAAPPDTFTLDDAISTIADDTHDLVAFVNTSRSRFCSAEQLAAENAFLAWVAGGEVGDPPQFPMQTGTVPLAATAKDVATGNIRFAFAGSVPVEMWTFEAGKSTTLGNLVAPCVDTDGIDDATGGPVAAGQFFAAGDGTWAFKDNDAEGTGPRSNVWGDRISASVSGPGGDHVWTATFKNHTVRGEYSGTATFTLRSR